MKYGNLTLGQVEAGINKIGGEEAFLRLLRGELQVSESTVGVSGYTRLISGGETLTLDAADGTETIAKADDLFKGYLSSDFKAYGCDVKGEPTDLKNVVVHEMIKDGTFEKIFGGLGDNLDSICLTQGQIIGFVKSHRKWLRTDGYATFFLFKANGQFFVACVCLGSGGYLLAFVFRFSDDGVLRADGRRRLVFPQL